MPGTAGPVILHLDLDAFFCAVEQLHKPSLRGRPVVVGGLGRRGVVSTASYEARAFGVGSAMPMSEARRRCPNAAFLWPRFAAYRAASGAVFELLGELAPPVEQVSIDEAYAVAAGADPGELGARIRDRVLARTGLTASVGMGSSKLIAKIASDLNKPDGLTVVPPDTEAEFLAGLPIRKLPGVGPATEERLRRRSIGTIGELAALPLADVVQLLGQAHGNALHQYAHGIDRRLVVPEREVKSISAEETFGVDLTDRRELADQLRRLAARVVQRLIAEGQSGRTVTLKLRHHDFTTITRSNTLDQPTDSVRVVVAEAARLLDGIDASNGIRLLGVGVSGLSDYLQTDLLAELSEPAEPIVPGEQSSGPASADPSSGPSETEPTATIPAAETISWWPGQDVRHADRGLGWVQGAGLGRVTVRFEGPHTGPGPIATLAVDDRALQPTDPPVW